MGVSLTDDEAKIVRMLLEQMDARDARDPQRRADRKFWIFWLLITLAVAVVVGLLLIEVGAYGGWR